MKLELIVKSSFAATHTLEENEKVHAHTWRVDTTLEGDHRSGRVISLPLAQELFERTLSKLRGSHLNTNTHLSNAAREVPTCENLALYFADEFAQALKDEPVKIICIEVGVDEESGGEEYGRARLTL